MSELCYIDRNLAAIRSRICAAEENSRDRFPERDGVLLLAAVKYADAEQLRYLTENLGIRDVGENRVQQMLEHWEALPNRDALRFHFIGTLQSNKVKYIIDKVTMIHSLDSLSLAKEIEKQAAKRSITVDVLAEINCGREENKSGLLPEEAEDFCLSLSDFPHLRLRGFMTMAPKCEKNEEYQKYFQETSQLCLDIWQKKLHNIGRPILSMGMSGSFEAAIEAGADVVRIGRSLFAH
ncbi:MAG: YggS family pyridoxal phosphate-dependent enzyme [Clostridia bacterium]|jgi:pyridoxal phosphate enzyme (YggS family)|nr:YggS family pyridoxal phosphate-dependent enzyme [Clostridia bacterium]MBQ1963331.1 YggS family pyridoxal phosphate-dependent enzyme [Clostridia bacterium]MBQ5833306.1 YggS family pyridoxal phosphate-dependent enzyme [Clostridia bacterium]